jgi:photosystem II stability/assembly factor-like uncharacterized protein
MTAHLKRFLLAIFFVALSPLLRAQIRWEPASDGISVVKASFMGTGSSTILAGAPKGIYRSTDHGATWSRVTGGASFVCFGIDGTGRLYATTDAGVLRSTDDGSSWTLLASIPLSYDLTVMPDGMLFTVTQDSTYRISPDGGVTTIQPVPTHFWGADMDVAPDGDLYFDHPNGVYRSTDRGVSWRATTSTTAPVGILAIDSAGALYVSQWFSDARGLVRSTDKGATWQTIDTGNTSWVSVGPRGSIFTLVDSGSRRGLNVSNDDGLTWSVLFPLGDEDSYGLYGTLGQSTIFFSAHGMIERSTDGGSSWSPSMAGIDPGNDRIDRIARLSSGTVLAAAHAARRPTGAGDGWTGGLYTSDDDGDHWSELSTSQGVTEIESAGDILAGKVEHFDSTGNGSHRDTSLIVSFDHGTTWSRRFPLKGRHPIAAGPNGMVAVPVDRGIQDSTAEGGIWITTDRGATWRACSVPATVRSVAITPRGVIVAVVADYHIPPLLGNYRVVRSTDAGQSWTVAADSIYSTTIVTGANGDLYLYISRTRLRHATYRSTDDGATWSVDSRSEGISRLIYDRNDTLLMLEATTLPTQYSPEVFKLVRVTEGGTNIAVLKDSISNVEITPNGNFYALVANDLLYPNGSTILTSFDQGTTWTSAMSGLDGIRVTGLAAGSDDAILAATTRGMFRAHDTADGTSSFVPVEIAPQAFLDIAPNPARDAASIRIGLELRADVSIEIVDLLGRTVTRPYSGIMEAGTHEIRIDMASLGAGTGSGIYLCRLTSNGRSVSRPLLLAR